MTFSAGHEPRTLKRDTKSVLTYDLEVRTVICQTPAGTLVSVQLCCLSVCLTLGLQTSVTKAALLRGIEMKRSVLTA